MPQKNPEIFTKQFKTLWLLFVVLSFLSGSFTKVSAQSFKQFSGKPESYVSELYKFLSSSPLEERKNLITFMEDEQSTDSLRLKLEMYVNNWDSLVFSSEEKEKILSISKNLIDKKVRAFPDYFQFVFLVQSFIEKGHSRESFNEWLDGMVWYCDNKKRSLTIINKILFQTKIALYDQLLFKSRLHSWKPTNFEFYFDFDSELKMHVGNCNLICYSKRDSIYIYNTKGTLYPSTSLWEGKNGEVTWERAGYERSVITSFLKNYQIDVSKSSYEADSVTFKNMIYFDKPLLGKIEDNVTYIKNPETATFPRFDSYIKEFSIKDLYPNINYKGGFSMQGAKFIGKGSIEKPAELKFYRKDSLRLCARSLFFIIRPEKIRGMDAAVSIYIDEDSIYHGDIQFNYTVKNNEISMMRSDNYSAQSPFMNSYHKIDMNFEQLTWRIDEPMLFITTTPGSSQGKALFESENFFNTNEYNEYQFMYDVHPLVSLKRYAAIEGSERFSAEDFASYMRTSLENVRVLLFPLAVKGFIFYDVSTEMIEMKKRLYDNISASVGRIDYDVLRFLSRTNAPLENASLDFRTNDLKIYGIPQVFVSDSQNVMIYPKSESIIMKRNRNFQFDGVVSAGLFTFFGRNFFFHYNDFKISLQDVDSIQLNVIMGYNDFKKPILQRVHNVIQDITGDILIDKPDNKSGIKQNPEYPIFNSREYSYVYYDDRKIFNGIYDRKKNFHFRIEPYTLDSLDNFTKAGLHFKGLFTSAGILPALNEELKLQNDFSLGFKHQTPANGYPAYGGKGHFTKLIHLSNQGLRGNGNLTYLCSKINSDDFQFFPDSTNTIAKSFELQAQITGIQCPVVNGDTVKIHWEPYKDVLFAKNIRKPFMIFNEETSHNGTLALSPKGLNGNGVLDMTTAVAHSNKFSYKYQSILADTSDFTLRSLHSQGYTVKTRNVSANIDLAKRAGKFKSNDLTSTTEFPENKYMAMLDEFTWKMDKKELEMVSSRKQPASTEGEINGFKDQSLSGSKYISTRVDQDSLSFVSPLAVYNYEKNLLQAKKVAYLEIADARIFPDKEQITINPEGYILPFSNSKVLANRVNRFHQVYDANVRVLSRMNYEANGKYDYKIDKKVLETFHFSEIRVDSTGHTYAEGSVTEPDSFNLSAHFPFQGNIHLRAEEKLLRFEGATRILQNCPNYASSWFLFDTLINPAEVIIPITPQMVELNRKFIVSGTLITTDSIHIYSSFYGYRKNYADSVVANATGILRYNEYNYSYEVAQREKLRNRDIAGNYMRINTKTCQHYAEGIIRPGVNYGQFRHKNSGVVEHDLKSNQVKISMSMMLDFFMHDKAMQRIAYLIDSLGKSPVDVTQNKFKKNFVNFVPEDKLNKYFEDLASGNKPKEIPEAFLKNIFIDEVNFVWDDVSNSYRSKGKIAIGYIAGLPIHKYFDGYMELWRKRSGDLFDLYIKIDEHNYFYIAYTRGTMHVTSSDKVFNTMIRELPENERTLKVPRGQSPYSFTMSTERKLQMLRKRWLTGDIDEEETFDQEIIEEQQSDTLDVETPVILDLPEDNNSTPVDTMRSE